MIHLGTETRKSAAQVLEQAIDYFGPNGTGLEVAHRDDTSVQLRGGGGHVTVRVQQEDKGMTQVDIESQEWERDAERFLAKM